MYSLCLNIIFHISEINTHKYNCQIIWCVQLCSFKKLTLMLLFTTVYLVYIFPSFLLQLLFIIIFKVIILQTGYYQVMFLSHSTNLSILIGVFRPFAFNVAIDMSGINSASLSVVCLFSVFFLLPSCGVLKNILGMSLLFICSVLSVSCRLFSDCFRYYILYM